MPGGTRRVGWITSAAIAILVITLAIVWAVTGRPGMADSPNAADRSGADGATQLAGSASPAATASGEGTPASPTPTPTPSPTPSPAPPPDITFTLLAAGDVLPHEAVRKSAAAGGDLDYSPLTAAVKPWIEGADLALCHLEVPVITADQQPSYYPIFGVQDVLIRDLAEDGWDGCSTASNHSIDRGFSNLAHTLDMMDQYGLGHAGTARSETESITPQLYRITREGGTVTVAHFAMTFGTNGLPLPADKPWSVNLIDTAAIAQRAAQARAEGADLVVVSVHDGTEYDATPTAHQRQVAAELAASGQVDLYIGHHAHVPQSIELTPGGPGGAGMWTAYGLGNFLSNQDSACCVPQTASGAFLLADFVKPGDGSPAHVTGVEWAATTVDRKGGHRVYPIEEVVATGVGTLSSGELQTRLDRVRTAVGTQAPEQVQPPVPTGDKPEVVAHAR